MNTDVSPLRSLTAAMKPVVLIGWAIAAVRLALDAFAPELAWFVGVYWFMPVVLAVYVFRGRLGRLSWGAYLLALPLIGLFVWAGSNVVAYTVAQFAEWTHGRFEPIREVVDAAGNVSEAGRSAPIADTAAKKVGTGLLVGSLTGLAGMFWVFTWGTVLRLVAMIFTRRTNA